MNTSLCNNVQAMGCALDASSLVALLERHQEKLMPTTTQPLAARTSHAETEAQSLPSAR